MTRHAPSSITKFTAGPCRTISRSSCGLRTCRSGLVTIKGRMTMYRKLLLCLCLLMLWAVAAGAQDVDGDKESAAKALSGMSIVGNDEAPKALYIVPWKSSEIGKETSLDKLLDGSDGPVDRDVFKRQLDFYTVSTAE